MMVGVCGNILLYLLDESVEIEILPNRCEMGVQVVGAFQFGHIGYVIERHIGAQVNDIGANGFKI